MRLLNSAAAVLLALCCLTAHAGPIQEVTFSDSNSGSAGEGSSTPEEGGAEDSTEVSLSFPEFDSSLGTLVGAELHVDGTALYEATLSSDLFDTACPEGTCLIAADFYFFVSGDYLVEERTEFSLSCEYGAFDPCESELQMTEIFEVDADVLGDVLAGPPSFTYFITGGGDFVGDIPVAGALQANVNMDLVGSITYRYEVPVGAPWGLLLLGAAFLGRRGRREDPVQYTG